jgi:hypothetical protein
LSPLRFGQLERWFWFQLVKPKIRTGTGTWFIKTGTGTWFIKTGSGFETAARNNLFSREKIWNWGLTADFRLDY